MEKGGPLRQAADSQFIQQNQVCLDRRASLRQLFRPTARCITPPCPARASGVTSGFQLKDTRVLSLYVGLMASGVYLRQGDKLIAMAEQPYATEDVLQKLLEHYPELLAGDTGDGEPRRWLLVDREVGLASDDAGASRWSVDHLFVDQDGVPTLVETKRSSDTRLRREAVGQMLDYAANAVVYWRLDRLQSAFEAACGKRGADSAAVLAEFLAPDDDPDAFWTRVRTNLAASRLRLVFVADAIPRELRRIVEFLNEQMGTTEVLAIEIKQYVDSGGNHQTLVPRLLGQTEAARRVKRQSEGCVFLRGALFLGVSVMRPG